MNKKADALVTGIIIVVIIIILILWSRVAARECSYDSDCSQYSYCGADHSCHQFEIKETVVMQNSFIAPSIVLGILIVGAAVFLRFRP